MHFDPRTTADTAATIRKLPTALGTLPAATSADFGSRPPWVVVCTSTLVASLHLDRGLFATWRCRGIGPAELPSTWFRPASGRPLYYRIDAVLAWLAGRRGEPFSAVGCWDEWLRTNTGTSLPSEDAVRAFAQRWAQSDGPVLDDGTVRFTKPGFQAYLAAFGDAP